MNRITPEALYRLLPAVHRLRDADNGEPLKALAAVLAREGAVIEENIEQLLDNLFIETCADWASAYIGGTVGYRALYPIEGFAVGNRAEVANTIGYRRRKGTAAVLEQLARDVTGWPARAVEYFRLVATCQHMNHIRPTHLAAAELGDPLALEPLGHAFDGVTRSIDVRSIQQSTSRESIGGTHNLPNIGLWLWRLMPMTHTRVPTTRIDARRYLFDPLGAPQRLLNKPQAEDGIASLAQPVNVPGNITRRMLHADPALWYGEDRALAVYVDDAFVPVTRIEACDLSDDGPGWNHSPHDPIAAADLAAIEGGPPLDPPANAIVRIDPELGRIAFPEEEEGEVRVSYRTGFPAPIGGGEYNRADSTSTLPGETVVLYPDDPTHPTLQSAVDSVQASGGIVEVTVNDILSEALNIAAGAGAEVVLRAADGVRPILRPPGAVTIEGGPDARVTLDGFAVDGARIEVVVDDDGASLKELILRHMTLIPGLRFDAAGAPANPGAVSLDLSATGVELVLDRTICGPITMTDTTNAEIRDSIVDAAAASTIDSPEGVAISGQGGIAEPGGTLTILRSTVIGRILALSFPLVSNAILFARSPDDSPPVRALRRQHGCMRFSFVPQDAVTPRRFRCQPQLAIDQAVAQAEAGAGGPITEAKRALIRTRIVRWLKPSFTALRLSHQAYAQLRQVAPHEIRAGASDESEMGAYHQLFTPQRETNLRIRLEEYLRFGLEAGIFYET